MRSLLGTLFIHRLSDGGPGRIAHGAWRRFDAQRFAGGRVNAPCALPQEMARSAYNSGVHTIKKAQEYDADAAKASTPEKVAKAHDKAQKYYHDSLADFIDAVAPATKNV